MMAVWRWGQTVLLGLACMAAGEFAAPTRAMPPQAPNATGAQENAAKDLTGTWQGTLHAGRDLRTVV